MSRISLAYACQDCGEVYGKWSGKCEACGAWNTLVEASGLEGAQRKSAPMGKGAAEFVSLSSTDVPLGKMQTGLAELDRVFGGGVIPASTVLIGGDPGIGKSTLMLQAAAALGLAGVKSIYISGEEATGQIQARATRLGLSEAPVQLLAATRLDDILRALQAQQPGFVVIDSIQTLSSDRLEAASGSVTQVRACTEYLSAFARHTGCVVALVGHVTKGGQLAGPRILEHMVDAVFYFEGEHGHQFRILRSVKNRFGPTDEIGVFEMGEGGLVGVADPSALFLGGESGDASGRAVLAAIEGSRPVLAEVQALVGQAAAGSARRSVVGWDSARLAMLLAVLESRCGLPLVQRDVYLSVAGGYKVSEPAGDLAAAAALVSSLKDCPLPPETVFFGEIALSGAVRPCARTETRIKEAARLGFKQAFISAGVADIDIATPVKIHRISTVSRLVEYLEQRTI